MNLKEYKAWSPGKPGSSPGGGNGRIALTGWRYGKYYSECLCEGMLYIAKLSNPARPTNYGSRKARGLWDCEMAASLEPLAQS